VYGCKHAQACSGVTVVDGTSVFICTVDRGEATLTSGLVTSVGGASVTVIAEDWGKHAFTSQDITRIACAFLVVITNPWSKHAANISVTGVRRTWIFIVADSLFVFAFAGHRIAVVVGTSVAVVTVFRPMPTHANSWVTDILCTGVIV
jgi:hypothetical protein